MSASVIGRIVSIALRTSVNGPMREVAQATASIGGGLEGDLAVSPERGITLLSKQQWQAVARELGVDLPWYTRRANLLVDCPTLAPLIGHCIRIGAVVLEIKGETDPCRLMDRQHPGLRNALMPDLRGGVYGRVREGGTVHVGYVVVFERTDSD